MLLNDAKAIKVGSTSAVAVYAGSVKVWPSFNAASGGTETTVTNYNGTGQTWKVHTFGAGSGSFVVTKAAQAFAVVWGGAGGGSGQTAQGTNGGRGGNGEGKENLSVTLTEGTYAVSVGAGGNGGPLDGWGQGNGSGGGSTTFNSVTASGGGGGYGPGDQNHHQTPWTGSPDGPQITSTVSGSSVTYGGNGGSPAGGYNTVGNAGSAGSLVIAYRVA